ncbi:MAG TPA: hypothetical protein VGK84_07945 [Candidatus Tumulicola sp.]
MKTARELIVAAVALLAFFIAFFSPAIFGGLMASGDAIVETIPALLGSHHLWEPNMLLGYPLYVDASAQYWYPLGWIVRAIPGAFNAYIVAPFVLAAFGTTGFVRLLTGSTRAGVIAGITFSLGGFMISHAGHPMIVHPAAWSTFVLWGLESLRRRPSAPALVAVALSFGLCGLSGQPQVFVFTFTLAIGYTLACAFGQPARPRKRYVVYAIAGIALGIAFAAPQLIPAAAFASQTTRFPLGFGDFTTLQIPPDQLVLRMLFPYALGGSTISWYPFAGASLGQFTEQTIAVGSIASTLALLAIPAWREDRRVLFWFGIAIVAMLLAAGDATPLAGIVYQLPVYNLLRIPGRHAFELTLAAAVLAGYGTAALLRGAVRLVAVVRAFAAVAIVAAIAYALSIAGHPAILSQIQTLYDISLARAASPLSNGAFGVPVATGTIGFLLLLMAARFAKYRLAFVCALAAVVLDLGCFGWSAYWRWQTTNWSALAPPAWVLRLQALSQARQTRIDWLPGISSPPLAPNLNLLYEVSLTGGYTPLRPRRLDVLLGVTDYGATTALPNDGDAALDIAGVGFAAMPAVHDNVTAAKPFADEDLHRFVGATSETPYSQAAFGLPAPFVANRILLVSDMGDSVAIPNDATVAELVVTDATGRRQEIPILAGRDTSEVAYDRTDVRPLVRHRRARVFSSEPGANHYLATYRLGTHAAVARVDVRWLYPDPTRGGMTIEKISLVNDLRGSAFSFGSLAPFYAQPHRWRRLFLDSSIAAFENLDAYPRAWMATPVTLNAAAAAAAIRTGRMPDGTSFDAASEATTDAKISGIGGPDAHDSVRVLEDRPARLALATHCVRSCFVVVRDAFDPQWRVTVDGVWASVVPADLALRGVSVPAGNRTVRFTFVPVPLYAGFMLCGAAALCCFALLLKLRAPISGRRST